jgi:hypothetical protein
MCSTRSQSRVTLVALAALVVAAACGDSTPPVVPVVPVATKLGFRAFAGGPTRSALPAVTVEIQDQSGNLMTGATNTVTLSFGANPGRLIFHASGIGAMDRIIELVDLVSLVVLPTLQNNEGQNEMLALAYDSAANVVFGIDRDDSLWALDPVTGARTTRGQTGLYSKGLTVEAGANGRLLAADQAGGVLSSLDRVTGAPTTLGTLVYSAGAFLGVNGIATEPGTGTIYAAVRTAGAVRHLAILNPTAFTLTEVALLSDNGVAGIAFLANGSLIAVTGDGGTNPETLWTVNKATGVMGLIMALGNGADGEAIAAVPSRLTGTLTAAAVNGVATFAGLQLTAPGTAYTFRASAAGLTNGASAAFNVTVEVP